MLYRKYFIMHIKSSFEYRLNILFIAFAQTLITVGELLAIYLMFQRFESVGGWGFYETLLMFGIVMTAFPMVECFFRGYDEFASLVKTGEFDRFLIRPVSIHYQIIGAKIELSKLGRVCIGILSSILAIINLNISWTFTKVLVLLSSYLCGICFVLGAFVLGAGISIYSIENLEFINIFTYGSKQLANYPINIYNKWLTRLFTFVLPVACFNYLPLSYIMEIGSIPPWLYAISPILGMLFLVPCFIFFNLSLKKYQSTGT